MVCPIELNIDKIHFIWPVLKIQTVYANTSLQLVAYSTFYAPLIAVYAHAFPNSSKNGLLHVKKIHVDLNVKKTSVNLLNNKSSKFSKANFYFHPNILNHYSFKLSIHAANTKCSLANINSYFSYFLSYWTNGVWGKMTELQINCADWPKLYLTKGLQIWHNDRFK